jgi:hypothetical protein
MLLSREDGIVARDPAQFAQTEAMGWKPCETTNIGRGRGRCPFLLSPAAVASVEGQGGGYYTCPVCRRSYDLLHHLPWHGVTEENATPEQMEEQRGFTPGGGTKIGLGLAEQGQIGEDLVEKMGQIPGYGKITWVHPGGANANSPLDMATDEWGIEVKTLGYDAMHHRFIPGRPSEKLDKNKMAEQMGKKGVLGVLVILDYRRSVADIYVNEMPLHRGVFAFYSHQGQRLVAEVPFHNPLLNPDHPAPHAANERPPEPDLPF